MKKQNIFVRIWDMLTTPIISLYVGIDESRRINEDGSWDKYWERKNRKEEEALLAAQKAKRYKIVMESGGGTCRDFMGGFDNEEDAAAVAADFGWEFADENRFVWNLEVVEE